jgi:superfamily II DNA helicase RecQ
VHGISCIELSSANPIYGFKLTQKYNEIKALKYKIVFCTPERITRNEEFIKLLMELDMAGKLERFVLDEVHVVKSWGDDFRPAYSALKTLKITYPKVPILGLTATCTIQMRGQISRLLGLHEQFLVF